MSATRRQQDQKQSERLMEINWRNDPDHDSSRNPIVEASLAATGADDDLDQRFHADYAAYVEEELKQSAAQLTDNPISQALLDVASKSGREAIVDSWIRDEGHIVVRNEFIERAPRGNAEADAEFESLEPDLVSDYDGENVAALNDNESPVAVTLRIDEVFASIAPYRALTENSIDERSLLGRSLLAQANAIFNTAFLNLQQRIGFVDVYAASPFGDDDDDSAPRWDVTSAAVNEVLRLQRLIA